MRTHTALYDQDFYAWVQEQAALLKEEMFQTCGSATLSESERTINASEGSDDHPSVALPLLPRE